MEWTTALQVAFIGGTVGLGAYCYICAGHVWRTRNASQPGTRSCRGLPGAIRRTAGTLLILGILGMALAVGWWLAVAREGLLEGDGLFTIRRPADLEVRYLAPAAYLEQGTVLARFHSPEAEAQTAVLQLRREGLAAETEALRHQTLDVDPEITQNLLDSKAHDRALRMNLNDLTLEKERLDRESLREQLARREQIEQREVDLRRFEAEAEQARIELQFCRDDHARFASLRERQAISEQQHAEKDAELESLQIEVQKLERQVHQTRAQKAESERGLEQFQQLSQQQIGELVASIGSVQDRLDEVGRTQRALEEAREADLRRAARHREERRKQLAIETAQTEKQGVAELEKLERRAPFDGRVVYRSAAPGNAAAEESLLVLAPQDGLRMMVRLPNWMKSPLENAGGIPGKLLEDLDRDERWRFVESRFLARLHRWETLPAHPGYGLAEFTCNAPAEAVRLLARGEQVAARLMWRPPLYTMPAFLLSLAMVVVTGTTWIVATAVTNPSPTAVTNPEPSPASSSLPTNGQGALAGFSAEYGGEGALLRLLGTQLRQMIVCGELDDSVIAAAEWALARHRQRAVHLLAAGLGEGPLVCRRLQSLIERALEDAERSHTHPSERFVMLRRLTAVLQAAAPEGSADTLRRIHRKLRRSAAGSNNRRHPYSKA